VSIPLPMVVVMSSLFDSWWFRMWTRSLWWRWCYPTW